MTPEEQVLTVAVPGLRGAEFKITSPVDPAYNCIAWAIGSTTDWWQPDYAAGIWPEQAPKQHTVAAAIEAFATAGYEPCENGALQDQVEKVAIYGVGEQFKHAARQLPSGRWTSKLGKGWDIEHELAALTSAANAGGPVQYGEVVVFLRRTRL